MDNNSKAYFPSFWGAIRFSNGTMLHSVKLTIGDDLAVYCYGRCKPNCRFVKVTRKGFNIVDLDTNRCLLKKHVYAKGMGQKEFPSRGPITGTFLVPSYFAIVVKNKPMESAV